VTKAAFGLLETSGMPPSDLEATAPQFVMAMNPKGPPVQQEPLPPASLAPFVWVRTKQPQYVDRAGTPYWQPNNNTLDKEGRLIGGSPLAAAPAGTVDGTLTYADLGMPVYDRPAQPGGQPTPVPPGQAINPNDFFYEEICPPTTPNGPPVRRLVRIPISQVRYNSEQGYFVTPEGRIAFQIARTPATGGNNPVPAGPLTRYSGNMTYVPNPNR
jgi:hypothetical protein